MAHAFSYQPPCRPHIQPKQPVLTVALGPGRAGDQGLSLGRTPAPRAVWSHSGGLKDWAPWVSGTAPPGFRKSPPGGSKGQRQPPGSLAHPHRRHRMQTDNKRNIEQCRRPPGSFRQTEQPCPGTSCARSLRVLFPGSMEKESSHRKQKEKDLGPGTSLPFILASAPPPNYLLVPPPTT